MVGAGLSLEGTIGWCSVWRTGQKGSKKKPEAPNMKGSSIRFNLREITGKELEEEGDHIRC